MTHLWAVFPALETNNLHSAWRVENVSPHESYLVETPELEHTVGRRVRLSIR